jgi:hypothetical protein
MYVKRQVADTLAIRNGLNTLLTLSLLLDSKVLVWRENKG